MQERLIQLFRDSFGVSPSAILEMAGDASTRSYRRLVGPDGQSAVGAVGPDHEENRAFLSFTEVFRDAGLPVPAVLAVDAEAGVYLLEDLGDTTLFDALEEERTSSAEAFPPPMVELYRRVVAWLPRFQVEGGRRVDYSIAYPRHAFDRQSILWDLNYFKYHFLKLAHIPFNEARLEADFTTLASFLLQADAEYFLYRDFQSRNITLRHGELWFIDYQGGRKGALQYDIASLLYDAKADLPEELREELLAHYMDCLGRLVPIERDSFRELYAGFVLVRIMQAMGAYGYRGFFERKPRFLRSVPYAARNIRRLLDVGLPLRLPEIDAVFRHIVGDWAPDVHERQAGLGLTVRLYSFSYRRGYPEDAAGHGGGFVLDCRALPNPGRETRFQGLSGRDCAVVDFLDRFPEVERFWSHVRELVDAQVTDYLRRDFDSLSVAFGCTGGQHRSVYFAERLARHLAESFPDVSVRLHHRERVAWTRHEVAKDSG
jgi:aminoglycoside/choline kinase family phosphotransferase